MKLLNIFESKIDDVYSEGFKQFLIDYNDIYDKKLFVVFSDQPQLRFNDKHTLKNVPTGMVMYPVRFVIKNPAHFTEYANSKYLYVVEVKSKALSIKNIKYSHLESMADIMGLSSDVLKEYIDHYNNSFNVSNDLFFAYVFNRLIWKRVQDGKTLDSDVDASEVANRIRRLGYEVYINNAENSKKAIISKSYPSIAIALTKTAVQEQNKFDLRRENRQFKDQESVGVKFEYFRDKDVMYELALKIAHSIDTRLNTDAPYDTFLDFYFWTVDGIQIRLTTSFSDNSGTTNDGVYFVVEMKTPFGVLIHSSKSDDSFDDIAKDVAQIYSTMTVAREDWRPFSRDLFLMNVRREQRFTDEQYQDLISVVNDYYPNLREYARVHNIYLPALEYFSEYERLFINDIFEKFITRPESSMVQLIQKLEDMDFNFDQFLFKPLPKRITVGFIKKIATVYDIGKKKFPTRKGWHVFKDL